MHAENRRLRLLAWVACALLCTSYEPLQAEEQKTEAAQPPVEVTAPVAEVTVPVEITGVVTEHVGNLSEVLLQVTGQTDSLLGLNVKPVDDVLRSHLGLAEGKGLVVTAVAKESALANADLRVNDVLLSANGDEISSLELLSKTLRGAPEKMFTIGIIRAGKKESIQIKPGSLEIAEIHRLVVQQQNAPRFRLGVGLADADETLRSQLSLLGGEGLVVTSVESDSPAAKSGVLVNDVLIKLDGKVLTSIDALQEQLQSIGDKAVSLELMRRGQPATLTVTPEKLAPAVETNWVQTLVTLDETRFAPLTVWTTRQADLSDVTLSVDLSESAKPDLAKQVVELLQQAKQLQGSLESLQAALKTPPQPAESGEK